MKFTFIWHRFERKNLQHAPLFDSTELSTDGTKRVDIGQIIIYKRPES